VQGRIIKVNELKIVGPNSEDVACVQAQQQGTFAVAGAASTGDSLCGATTWEISSVTTPFGSSATNADLRFGVTQGVGVRIRALDVPTSCPNPTP
jgi:hypothetical protein